MIAVRPLPGKCGRGSRNKGLDILFYDWLERGHFFTKTTRVKICTLLDSSGTFSKLNTGTFFSYLSLSLSPSLLTNVTPADSGIYRCSILADGQASRPSFPYDRVVENVLDVYPVLSTVPAGDTFTTNTPVRFTCSADYNSGPTAAVEYMIVKDGGVWYHAMSDSITVSSADVTTSGVYYCVIRVGGVESYSSNSLDVKVVEVPPRVHGGWSQWSQWTPCSVTTCAQSTTGSTAGVRSRSRVCDSPAPANAGLSCEGENTDTTTCSTDLQPPCPVDPDTACVDQLPICPNMASNGLCTWAGAYCKKSCGNCDTTGPVEDLHWAPWSEWTPCTATCGSGNSMRFRLCNKPAEQQGGGYCQGSNLDSRRCQLADCVTSLCGDTHPFCGRWAEADQCHGIIPATHCRKACDKCDS